MAMSKTRGTSATRRHQAARPISSRPTGKRPPAPQQAGAPPANRAADESAFDRGERRGVFDAIDADLEEGVR